MVSGLPNFSELIHIKSSRDLPHLAVVVLLISGIILGVYLALQPQIFNKKAAEGAIVDLKFVPENLQMESGKIYEVKIAVNPKGERLTAVKLHMEYDPGVVSVLETQNSGYLPVTLKIEDARDGNLTLVYASTIESQPTKPGMLSVIKVKALNPSASFIRIMPDSEASVASRENNVLTVFPQMALLPLDLESAPQDQPKYPDNLLLEKAFFASSAPAIRDFRESLEPKPEIKPERVKPEFSMAFVKQLGTDIFITPIQALNQVLEEKVGSILMSE